MERFEPIKTEIEDPYRYVPVGIGIFEIVDGVTHQRYMNDCFYAMVRDRKHTRDNRSGGDFFQSIHPEDRKNVAAAIQQVKNGADRSVATCRALTGDDGVQWMRLTASVAERREGYILVYCSYADITQEMDARRTLERNNALLRQALESAGMAVWEYDPVNKILTQTEDCMGLTGYPNRVVRNVPQSMLEAGYVHSSCVEAYIQFFQTFREKACAVEADFQVKNLQTGEFWWEHTKLVPIFDDAGKLCRGIGTSIDISGRKKQEHRYEQQIHEMEEMDAANLIAKGRNNITRNQSLYFQKNSVHAIPTADDGEYDAAMHMLMDSAADAEGRQLVQAHLNRKTLIERYQKGILFDSFMYRRTAEDDIIWCETRLVLSEEPDSHDVIVFIYSYDVTERVMGEQLIQRVSELEYDVLGVITIHTESFALKGVRGQMMTDELSRTMPYAEKCRSRVEQLVAESEQAAVLQKLSLENLIQQLAENKVYAFPYFVTEHGERRRKQAQVTYLDDARTKLLFCRSDITDMYRHEQEQLQITEKALIAAKRANEAKTDFLSRMSHDIRTPMNAIIGLTKLAQEEKCPEQIAKYLNHIETSSNFLLGLINDILDLSKIESGQFALNPEPCPVEDFDAAINTIIRPLMEKKNINFVYQMNCGAQCLLLDKLRFNQIFFNLLSNAAKFTPEGGKVEFLAEHIPPRDGVYGARYIIRDNGIGMSAEFLQHMFEPFSQEQSAQEPNNLGTGLGLPIVKSLVDAMDGTISVTSKLGEGTEYVLDLYTPLAERPVREDAEKQWRQSLMGKQILLAEDNALNILVAEHLLEKEGCVVTVAKNGREAAELFEASAVDAFDAILMDVRMPVMDGLSAARLIRSMTRADAETIPILAMTADAFAEEKKKTLEAGMNYHLTKPIDPEKLYDVLAGYIRKRGVHSSHNRELP